MKIKVKDLVDMSLSDDSQVRIVKDTTVVYDGSVGCVPSEYMDMYVGVIAPGSTIDSDLFLWIFLSRIQD